MTGALKQHIAEAEKRRTEAKYMSICYGLRADQITNGKRKLDFISLGVGPGLLMLVADNSYLRKFGLGLAAVCSLAAYIWAIFIFSFQWDRQQEVARNASSEAIELFNRFENLLAEANDSKTIEERLKQVMLSIERESKRFWNLNDEIDKATVHIKPWMKLMAQQQTMLEVGSSCGECGTYWDKKKHQTFSKANAKAFQPGDDTCANCGLFRCPQ